MFWQLENFYLPKCAKSVDKETLEAYYAEDAAKLREDVHKLFPNKFVSFRTELQVISEH